MSSPIRNFIHYYVLQTHISLFSLLCCILITQKCLTGSAEKASRGLRLPGSPCWMQFSSLFPNDPQGTMQTCPCAPKATDAAVYLITQISRFIHAQSILRADRDTAETMAAPRSVPTQEYDFPTHRSPFRQEKAVCGLTADGESACCPADQASAMRLYL